MDTSRVIWNTEEKHAQKCDLCKDTPFWDEQGGPEGKRACEQVCPTGAISFTKEIPLQSNEGYVVNLRDGGWAQIGYPIDDAGTVNPKASAASH
jgi:protein NrfC